MKHLALEALDAATAAATGPAVTYADTRVMEIRDRQVSTKNGKTGHVSSGVSMGLAIRVLADGCWGFAATDDLTRDGVHAAAALALEIARAGTLAKKHDITLAPEEKYEAEWVSPILIDPFTIPVDRNVALLLDIDRELRRNPGVTLAEGAMSFERRRQVFASSLGSLIDQTRYLSGVGYAALAYKDGEIQKRSYPNSFGGQHQLKGYELVDEWNLVGNAARIAEEAVALHSADQCPEGEFDLILDSSQLGLQIHESIGHPIELDRVLGSEANYAGMSFLTLDQLAPPALRLRNRERGLRCPPRNTVLASVPSLSTTKACPRNPPTSSATAVFTGYMTSRETAAAVGESRSNGTMRADGWSRHAAHPHDQCQPAGRASSRSKKCSMWTTPSTWRPTGAGPSTTSATTSSSAARSAGRSATASASAC